VKRRTLAVAAGSLLGAALLALGLACATSGCGTVGYYGQSVRGHPGLMWQARPVDDWLADPATDPALRKRLALAKDLRAWAVHELQLPDNASYRRYAPLDRPAAVWNVVAAPALSLTLKTWCFPVMGCVGYRGYYDRADADAEAAALRAAGWEALVYGVPAYSTLGWTNWLGGDPLLSTFIRWPDAELARMLFHEMAHQVVYVGDDTVFNESYATAVERLGVQRWLAEQGTPAAREAYAEYDGRRQQFRALTRAARADLERIYADPALDDAAKTAAKAERWARLRADFELLKRTEWHGFAGYDRWFEQAAQAPNAALGIQAAYDALVPAFERLFEREGRDFPRFYDAVRALAHLPKDQRAATLRDLS